jgi:hypothetical protein
VGFSPFDLNDNDTNLCNYLCDSDPDLQFYNDSTYIDNINQCDYYLEESFKKKCCQANINEQSFSIFHHNIRSVPKNSSSLQNFLESLNFKFTIIGLSETWLTESIADCYNWDGYDHYYLYRKGKRGGGVSIYVEDNVNAKQRQDLSKMSEVVEILFIEICKENTGLAKNVLIGIVYRPPGQDVNLFNYEISDILDKTTSENALVYLMGDFNINILDVGEHLPSSEFLDIMYAHSLIPFITKPTRITSETATLIDNIFTNDIASANVVNGLFYTDISDHLPIFSINSKCKICTKKKIDKNQNYQSAKHRKL